MDKGGCFLRNNTILMQLGDIYDEKNSILCHNGTFCTSDRSL